MYHMIKTLLAGLLFIGCSSSVLATEKEVWQCKDLHTTNNEIIVTATAFKTSNHGLISVAGTEQTAHYEVAGFNRQWKFGSKSTDNSFKYLFRINPNGVAHYFDISDTKEGESIESEMVLICNQTGSAWSTNVRSKPRDSHRDSVNSINAVPCLPGLLVINYSE